ncbi:13243_t:CDS:2, partial [Dentiscutata erythropus]
IREDGIREEWCLKRVVLKKRKGGIGKDDVREEWYLVGKRRIVLVSGKVYISV